MSLNHSFISALFALLAFSQVSSADAMPDMKAKLHTACQSDLQKFCSDVTSGEHREMACLKSHEDKLSSGCATEWQASRTMWKQTMRDARNACSSDVQKFCKNAADPKEISSCLQDHATGLSTDCKSFQSTHQMGGEAMENSAKNSDQSAMDSSGQSQSSPINPTTNPTSGSTSS